nr:hypothetical transcript [Hymenolepis microstoma]
MALLFVNTLTCAPIGARRVSPFVGAVRRFARFRQLIEFTMGVKSSKLVITPENAETAANVATGAITQLKSNGEKGNVEVMPPIDVAESNGVCEGVTDTTAETPYDASITETKQKKSNSISWIQKKISFKKVKTPKKSAVAEGNPAEPVVEESHPVITEEKEEEEEEAQSPSETGDAQVQSEEVPKADQGTIIPENLEVEQSAESVIEISPSIEEVQVGVGKEQFVEEEGPNEEQVEEVKQNGGISSHELELTELESYDADMGISAKISNFTMDAVESLSNGNAVHLNGDTVVPADEIDILTSFSRAAFDFTDEMKLYAIKKAFAGPSAVTPCCWLTCIKKTPLITIYILLLLQPISTKLYRIHSVYHKN